MKKIPFSYSTTAEINSRARRKAKKKGTSIAKEIHAFLEGYVADEPSEPGDEIPPKFVQKRNGSKEHFPEADGGEQQFGLAEATTKEELVMQEDPHREDHAGELTDLPPTEEDPARLTEHAENEGEQYNDDLLFVATLKGNNNDDDENIEGVVEPVTSGSGLDPANTKRQAFAKPAKKKAPTKKKVVKAQKSINGSARKKVAAKGSKTSKRAK